jgi:cell wall-associated NlpC family hydrolase
VRLPRTARDQWRAQRRHRVSRSHRRPGDLVALLRKGRAYHMGVYVGRGRMVHAPHRGARVRTDRVPGKAHYARLVK